jgi:anthranilate phosphoribosyltransferase
LQKIDLVRLLAMTDLTWSTILTQLLSGEDLTRQDASWAMRQIMSGEATPSQIGAFMLALRAKGETADELSGLVDVMLENALLLETGSDAVDIVGTGGDLLGTVNISSMASIVAAAAGTPVLKHGSRSASGKTGSSEMLEVLGIRLDLSPQQVSEVFKKVGITFFFAPVFHPAMRHVAPIRKELGIPTTFNFLGPLANPAQPLATALGVANPQIAPLMALELAQRGRTALVFRSEDGLDELSTTATNQIWQVSDGKVTQLSLDSSKLGLQKAQKDWLIGGDAQHNAQVAMRLFEGEKFENQQAIHEIVALNAAAGLVSYNLAKNPQEANKTLEERFQVALESSRKAIDSGAALAKLSSWSAATQQF